MGTSVDVHSGEWQHSADFLDYRAEWLSDVLVERATYAPNARVQNIQRVLDNTVIARDRFVWVRFWYRQNNQIFEKYFDAEQRAIGVYIPVCMPIEQNGSALRTVSLVLGLWIDRVGRVTVMGEDAFDAVVAMKKLSPVQIEQAEHRIRELTHLVHTKKFPPAMVRNFSLVPESKHDCNS